MKEDGFEFLELFGNIDESYIMQALEPWKGQTGRYVVYRMGRKAACLFIILMLGFCMVFHNQVYAAVSRFATMIGEILGLSDNLMPYTEIINTTQAQDGVGITLKEVIWTGNSLLVSVYAKGLDEDDGASVSAGDSIKINGQEAECDSMKVYCREGHEETGSNYVVEWDFGNSIQIDGKVDIEIEIILHRHMEDIEGTAFVFAFSASEKELQENAVWVEPNKKIKIGDRDAVLMGLSLNSITSSIQIECVGLQLEESQYYLKATDQDGEEFLYSLINIQDGAYIFQSDREPPSLKNEWLDIQMYVLPHEWEGDGENSSVDGEQMSGVIQIDDEKMEPVGQKIRIKLKKKTDGKPESAR